jgi:hypothetical protein
MVNRDVLGRALGVVECILGAALLYQGCRYGFWGDDGLSNLTGTFMVVSALFAFIVPGSLMFLRNPLRWLSQVPVLMVVLWLSYRALSRTLGR